MKCRGYGVKASGCGCEQTATRWPGQSQSPRSAGGTTNAPTARRDRGCSPGRTRTCRRPRGVPRPAIQRDAYGDSRRGRRPVKGLPGLFTNGQTAAWSVRDRLGDASPSGDGTVRSLSSVRRLWTYTLPSSYARAGSNWQQQISAKRCVSRATGRRAPCGTGSGANVIGLAKRVRGLCPERARCLRGWCDSS